MSVPRILNLARLKQHLSESLGLTIGITVGRLIRLKSGKILVTTFARLFAVHTNALVLFIVTVLCHGITVCHRISATTVCST